MGLEVDVLITPEELGKLEKLELKGILKFVDYHGSKKEIIMSINYDKNQKEYLKEWHIPLRSYFGDAKNIMFAINKEFYENLIKTGSFGDRFLNPDGKLVIKVDK